MEMNVKVIAITELIKIKIVYFLLLLRKQYDSKLYKKVLLLILHMEN